MLRKLTLIAVVAAMLFAGVSLTSTRAQESLKIGLLTDRTGGLALYGTELEQGFTLGLKYATNGTMEVGGRKIELLTSDTQSKPDVGASVARELVEKDGAEILVGAPSSGVTLQVQQIASDLGVMLFAGPAASPDITGKNFNLNTFRVCRNSAQDAGTLASVVTDLDSPTGTGKIKKVFIFAADNAFGKGTAAVFEAAYKAAGLEVLPALYAPLETTEFTPFIQQILASGADALQPIWAGAAGAVALYKQFEELGVYDKVRILDAFNSNPVAKAAYPPSDNLSVTGFIVYHYTLPKTEINDWLVENHKADYKGTVPDLFTECGFATAQALVAGLTKTEGAAEPETMIPALEGLSFDGPRGTYTIRASDHQALMPMYVVRMINNTDPDFKFYELVKEVPAEQAAPPCLLEGDFKARCEQ